MPRRSRRSGPLRALRQAIALLGLPAPVRRFYVRALGRAALAGDRGTLRRSARPRELAVLAQLAVGRRHIVEIGTGSGWSAAALALAEPGCTVDSFDPKPKAGLAAYLALLPDDVRRRIRLHVMPGERPPPDIAQPELLFIDGSHKFESVVTDFTVWRPRVAAGGVVVFHDFGDPTHPEVERAVTHLGLDGRVDWNMFIWEHHGG